MCFDFDSRPPDLPSDLIGPPIAGGAAAEHFTLESADGTEFACALAQAAEGGRTGVVIVPDVRGLHPFYVALAERFAEAGHHAIAFDFYGRTAGPGPRDEGFDYAPHREQVKLDRALEDIAAAAETLRTRTRAEAVATVGFCFGGSLSFVAATRENLGLSRAVGFYGVLDPERFDGQGVLTQAERTSLPVLGLFGGADQAIPVEQVEEYDAALDEAGVEHEIHVYPGAPHSFFDKKQEEFAEESEDSWRKILEFL
jgi:carboxymethylenebutenolidase